MAEIYTHKPEVMVMSGDGRSTVVYDPLPGTPEGAARQVHFSLDEQRLIISCKDNVEPLIVSTATIKELRILPAADGNYSLVAALVDGGAVDLLAGLPDQQTSWKLANALQQSFALSLAGPLSLPVPDRQPEPLDLPIQSYDEEPAKPFTFVSRPYGLVLLVNLGVAWILGFVSLAYLIVIQPSVTIDTLDAASTLNTADTVGLVIETVAILVYMFSPIIFLLWIYKVHRDLARLFPGYQISPAGAVVQVSVPIYAIFGVSKVFRMIGEEFMPPLNLWPGLLPIAYILSSSGTRLERLGAPAWLDYLFEVIALTVWIIVTQKLHSALAGRARAIKLSQEPMNNSPAAVFEANLSLPAPKDMGKRRSMSRRLKIGLITAPLVICGICTCTLTTLGITTLGQWFNRDYFRFQAALNEHLADRDAISIASVEFSWIDAPDQETEVWLVIGLETAETCRVSFADPCEMLADEIAAFALENYARIDEMAGLEVTVTTVNGDNPDWTTPDLDKFMTIPEWRQELGAATDLYPFALTLKEDR